MQFLRKYLLREPSQSEIQAYIFYGLNKKIICKNYKVHKVVFNDIHAVTMTVCWHYLLFQFSNFEFPNLAI
jgi:hypothetical protein